MFLGFSPFAAEADDDFIEEFAHKWQERATRTQASQPKWSVPMVAPFPQLAQVYRTAMIRQETSEGHANWNFGGGKGFNLIPFANTQVDILPPGYVVHGDGGQDGIGDTSLLVKYRFASANEQHGNYIVSGALNWSIPTGSHKNGAPSAVLTPTLLTGKGFGKFALMTSLGGGLPTSQTATSGRTIQWNTVAQYHVRKYLWPELELNSTSYVGGTRDGKTQMFLTPGIIFGKFALRPENPKSRLGMVAGIAFQTAVTSFHTYNHAGVVSVRFAF